MKLRKLDRSGGGQFDFAFYCPGCEGYHGISIHPPGPVWQFNGDLERPTFSPSLRVEMGPECDQETGLKKNDMNRLCHSFIRDGNIEFLSDCTHELAGKVVEIPDIDKLDEHAI